MNSTELKYLAVGIFLIVVLIDKCDFMNPLTMVGGVLGVAVVGILFQGFLSYWFNKKD